MHKTLIALTTAFVITSASAAQPAPAPAAKQTSALTGAIVDATGKTVGRYVGNFQMITTINGQWVTVILGNEKDPAGNPRNTGKMVVQTDLFLSFYYASYDCSGTAFVQPTGNAGAIAQVGRIGATKNAWTSSASEYTLLMPQSARGVYPDGTVTGCNPYDSGGYSYIMFPVNPPVDLKTLWTEPLTVQ
jgi:hypothetical protein